MSLNKTTFNDLNLYERSDLQRLLRSNIEVISPDTLVIAEEFSDWEGARDRIDLLGIDRDANLVVIELKRTEDGGYMDLQALRYAAMISTMTFDKAVDAFARFLSDIGEEGNDAKERLLNFLGWPEPNEDDFAQDVRIVLASAEFAPQLTTSVMWLNDRGIDIRCVRLQPYNFEGRALVDVQPIVPLPEASDYQVKLREKTSRAREARSHNATYERYDLQLGDKNILKKQPKRGAIYKTFSYLVNCGIAPEDVLRRSGLKDRLLMSVEGEVQGEEFISLAARACEDEGRRFDPGRFFCADDKLIRLNGRTYAFSNQWGAEDWRNAMNALCEAFPDQNVRFSRSEE